MSATGDYPTFQEVLYTLCETGTEVDIHHPWRRQAMPLTRAEMQKVKEESSVRRDDQSEDHR